MGLITEALLTREEFVALLDAQSQSHKQIAGSLGISARTLHRYRAGDSRIPQAVANCAVLLYGGSEGHQFRPGAGAETVVRPGAVRLAAR